MAVLEKKHLGKLNSPFYGKYESTPNFRETRRNKSRVDLIQYTGQDNYNMITVKYYSASEMFENDKEFVRINREFKIQFSEKSELFPGLNFQDAHEKMKTSLSEVLNFSPEKISLQLTHEGSLFYTFLKDGAKFYIQHYLTTADNEDEAFLNIFYSDQKNENFAGELSNILKQLRTINTHSIA
ncbi:MAG: hypothetical protein H7329_05835 [Opitutaceae bacterium]|nr:hypothetical protein [Cytophagales bacterium]